MGVNIGKWCYQQGVKIQNIQTADTNQYQKKQPSQKCRRPK